MSKGLLEGKVCIVTGVFSERGIGFATARLFAAHGARVAMVDIALDEEREVALREAIAQAAGPGAVVKGYKCDLSSEEECARLADAVESRFGRIDVALNGAAIVVAKPTMEISSAEFDRMTAVNLRGTFNFCQAVLAKMLARRAGSIINLASVAAQRGGGLVGGAHYAASKGGVVSFTKSIAREFGPQGIRANAVCPSLTETAVLDGKISREQIDEIISAIPMRRAGTPDDIAGACLFLASDLSSYVTGATIDVNGGSHIH
ncbi:SDR family NAD(P)-dependent oxidoreductase [Aureimonas populi]|uniref:SDR family NAD(P)-dependent oxidoreductase n=1 Tax=Aureimonas populi TaxID=1701758 RepID=A0ABW5CQW7_9HYPH|nr:SDR family NAD(P)-dependent oxidoreductase [Aureimonas populi]